MKYNFVWYFKSKTNWIRVITIFAYIFKFYFFGYSSSKNNYSDAFLSAWNTLFQDVQKYKVYDQNDF